MQKPDYINIMQISVVPDPDDHKFVTIYGVGDDGIVYFTDSHQEDWRVFVPQDIDTLEER